MTTQEKAERMYNLFGKAKGICKECDNLYSYTANKTWYKCKVYGISSSEATDWRVRCKCCGMKNNEYKGTPVYKLMREGKKKDIQIEGQISLF